MTKVSARATALLSIAVSLLLTTGLITATAGPAAATSLATGDARTVSQPSIPSTCATVTATLSTTNREFSSSAETSPPDTSRIESALDTCLGTGKAVVLAASGSDNAFLAGPLTVGGGEVLVIDAGVTLYASRNAANYQVSGQATCGTVATSGNGCKPFITVNGANAGIMGTQSSSGSQGLIDGRGDLDILGQSTTWWGLAATAQTDGEDQNNPRLIQSNGVNNFTVYDLSLTNSPNFHLVFNGGTGFTVWGLRIKTPANARNTDGIDPSGADVTINDSYIQDGDDGVAIKAGSSASDNMTIENSHFYGTHGISIGSETNAGVNNIMFKNDTLSGTDSSGIESTSNNGMRIKSYAGVGGVVSTVTYEDICMTGVQDLLDFNPFYATATGTAISGSGSVPSCSFPSFPGL